MHPKMEIFLFIELAEDVCFAVELTTKKWASEIGWSISSKEGYCSSNQAYRNEREYSTRCCIRPGSYVLKCVDRGGDGWHGSYIRINGINYCQNFESGKEMKQSVEISANQNSG